MNKDFYISVTQNRSDIGSILSCKASQLGYSERDIEIALGCSKSTVHNIHEGKTNTDLDLVLRYAYFLGLDPLKTVFKKEFLDLYLPDRDLDTNI